MCRYSYTYLDGSVINGIVGIENLNFLVIEGDDRVTLQKTFIGCGWKYSSDFKKDREGAVGLKIGPSSLISQMKSLGGYKFFYCLINNDHENSKSQMVFGEEVKLIGKPTKIGNKSRCDSFVLPQSKRHQSRIRNVEHNLLGHFEVNFFGKLLNFGQILF